MIISHAYTELKRRAKNGCLESIMDIADSHGEGKNGLKKNNEKYLSNILKLLDHIEEYRQSDFSTCRIFYEIMYAYAEMGNDIRAEEYHHYLMWELAWDYPSQDLEPYIEEYQIREFAEYFDIEIEDILDQVKAWQQDWNPEKYKIIEASNFFDTDK